MLLSVNITAKSMGAKELFRDLGLSVAPKEKIGLIGRNGVGKTTLFNILSGTDPLFSGQIEKRRGLTIVATRQEHDLTSELSAIDYILANLPEYAKLKHILDTYPAVMGRSQNLMNEYSDALERFNGLGYYQVAETAERALQAYQLSQEQAHGPFARLSGGQKRFVELVRVELAHCDLALIDEPTNHMDSQAKAAFISWMQHESKSILVITHDRDVLQQVDRIIEIKDLRAYSFSGNYDRYLAQNSLSTAQAMDQYEVNLRTIENLNKQIAYARTKKAGWGGTADKKNPFVVMEERARRQIKAIESELVRPSFWIDRESVVELSDKVADKYDRYKARNLRIRTSSAKHDSELLMVTDLTAGYDQPIIKGVDFRLGSGDRVRLLGRNGAGKTTLIRAVVAECGGLKTIAKRFGGQIEANNRLRLGVYEQEIDPALLGQTLEEAVLNVLRSSAQAVSVQSAKQLMADYLFDPTVDSRLRLSQLSGGQKARYQIIKMLGHQPNVLILDEPTNHLDLPSIEELENALAGYHGAVLYVSHDSYFARQLGGQELLISAIES